MEVVASPVDDMLLSRDVLIGHGGGKRRGEEGMSQFMAKNSTMRCSTLEPQSLICIASLARWRGPERPLIMPTDLEAASARKRAEQAQAQTETTIMLVWLVVYLSLLGLVYEVFGR